MLMPFRQCRNYPDNLRTPLLFAILFLFIGADLVSAPTPKTPAERKARRKWIPQGDIDQDFPFQNACIGASFPSNNIANKGIALKLGNDAFVCFDTDLLRMSAGWTGQYLNFSGVTFTGEHGNHPSIVGAQK